MYTMIHTWDADTVITAIIGAILHRISYVVSASAYQQCKESLTNSSLSGTEQHLLLHVGSEAWHMIVAALYHNSTHVVFMCDAVAQCSCSYVMTCAVCL